MTSQATLSAVIKNARDTMRKDSGLSGDIDRIPQLAWLLFLKAFDAQEQEREVVEADFEPAIAAPYRWRDWAADPIEGKTGEELLEFVNSDLIPYLRSLSGTRKDDPRDVIADVFKETHNRMLSGYLLRDVIDEVNKVDFTSSDDIHTMAHLYESMLRQMRDAAGDAGEFYTPRPVIRFIVEQVDPQLGESLLDPAAGTGGFLVEAYEHLRPKVSNVEDLQELEANLQGIEKKPLPYLLGMMNLLLHGIKRPAIVRQNALAQPVTQIAKRDKVDVVLTNPPFGGEEEKGIQDNFPAATQTAETSWLFLQLVMRRLKPGGRCGIVVPNGVLFAEGVGARIKEQLLSQCDLHTIVRLPDGVFAPYTDIPTNLLFFEKTGGTKEVWFYELPLPEGRRKYTKTNPLHFDEFEGVQEWWGGTRREGREETDRSWRVPIADIQDGNYDLDVSNPRGPDDLTHRPPSAVIAELLAVEQRIEADIREIQALIGEEG
jgi:type I restriction enzyme M protein